MKTLTIVFVILLACSAWAQSQVPSPAPSESGHKPKANPAQHEEASAKDQRGTETSPLFIKVVPPTAIEPEPTEEHEKARNYTSSEWWLVYLTGALSAVTFVLALYTGKLYRATVALGKDAKTTSDRQAGEMQETLRIARESSKASRDAADVARDAMVAGERAFVFAIGIKAFWTKDNQTDLYHWKFRPQWQNSGDTPTKNMTMYTDCMLLDGELPMGFNFDGRVPFIGKALIPPKILILGGIAPAVQISPEDIIQVQAGKKFLYLWGWARYFDVFPETPQHITRFCWGITPVGDPMTYLPKPGLPDSLYFESYHHNEGNCADDECNP